jgi:acetylornithine deacetylase/succinyl-diaminopimelate desuccinylase-like protein
MINTEQNESVFRELAEGELVSLTRNLISIPSSTFQEAEIADFLAGQMEDIGLCVSMMDVDHPSDHHKRTRQPVGRLPGTGGGRSLMLNAHMDTNVVMPGWSVDPHAGKLENGWIWGLGSQDDKGGLAAAICAVKAVIQSKGRLRGDVLVCPVAAHKLGGTGTRTLLKNGVRADYCINVEHSANTIATVAVGSIRVKISTSTPGLFFRFTEGARLGYLNAIEQQCEIVRRLGPSLKPIPPRSWLRFTPHSELQDFPMIRYDTIHKDHYGRDCVLVFQIRTVPGQTIDKVGEDVVRVLQGLKKEKPEISYEIAIPANGPNDPFFMEPSNVPSDDPLVLALSEGQSLASGLPAVLGSVERAGNFGDGNVLNTNGVVSVQYGPGDIKIYSEWPAPDERVQVSDLATTAKAIAHAVTKISG